VEELKVVVVVVEWRYHVWTKEKKTEEEYNVVWEKKERKGKNFEITSLVYNLCMTTTRHNWWEIKKETNACWFCSTFVFFLVSSCKFCCWTCADFPQCSYYIYTFIKNIGWNTLSRWIVRIGRTRRIRLLLLLLLLNRWLLLK